MLQAELEQEASSLLSLLVLLCGQVEHPRGRVPGVQWVRDKVG